MCGHSVCVLEETADRQITLGQLGLLNLAGPIAVEGLEDALPLVNVVEKLLELVQVDRAGGVLVKDVCNNDDEISALISPCCNSENSMNPLRSRSMLSKSAFHWLM